MSAFGPPVDGLRTLRIVVVLIAVGVCVNTCGVIVSFVLNSDRVDQINAERAQNVERNCDDINNRHDRTIGALDQILAKRLRSAGPAERARLRTSRETTVLLIEALVPQRDCARLAREQVDSK